MQDCCMNNESTSSHVSRHLTVSRTPLVAAAKRLRKLCTDRRLKTAELALRYTDGDLQLDLPGAAEAVPATGHWPGLLRTPALLLLMLAKGELSGDCVELSVDDDGHHLRVHSGRATLRFKAAWADLSPPAPADFPLDATDLDLLRMAAAGKPTYPPAVRIASCLEADFAGAEKRFQKAVNDAHTRLAAYDINRAEFETVVRGLLLKRTVT